MRIFGPSLANEQVGELREALVSTDLPGAKTLMVSFCGAARVGLQQSFSKIRYLVSGPDNRLINQTELDGPG
jgi:hypothetical protein